MQALRDIFSIWGDFGPDGTPDCAAIATALNEKQDTVYRWWYRKRIPERSWLPLITAAQTRGKHLTVADMHAANRPPKARGGAHKMKPMRRRRAETRVES